MGQHLYFLHAWSLKMYLKCSSAGQPCNIIFKNLGFSSVKYVYVAVYFTCTFWTVLEGMGVFQFGNSRGTVHSLVSIYQNIADRPNFSSGIMKYSNIVVQDLPTQNTFRFICCILPYAIMSINIGLVGYWSAIASFKEKKKGEGEKRSIVKLFKRPHLRHIRNNTLCCLHRCPLHRTIKEIVINSACSCLLSFYWLVVTCIARQWEEYLEH